MLRELIDVMRGSGDFMSLVVYLVSILFIIFFILPFHEWAHAFVAGKLGDTSIKYRGRLTLNPLSHVDPIGALCLVLFGFGWAKPVPVDSRYFKNPKVGMALTALAGPVANILAALAGGFIYFGLYRLFPSFCVNTSVGWIVVNFLYFYISINAGLAVFNLIPIPPLDGSKILFAFLPDKHIAFFYRYQNIFFIAFFALIYTGVLDIPLSFLQNGLLRVIAYIASFPFKLF